MRVLVKQDARKRDEIAYKLTTDSVVIKLNVASLQLSIHCSYIVRWQYRNLKRMYNMNFSKMIVWFKYVYVLNYCFQGQEYAPKYLLEYQRTEHGRWIRFRNRKGQEVSIQTSQCLSCKSLMNLLAPVWSTCVLAPIGKFSWCFTLVYMLLSSAKLQYEQLVWLQQTLGHWLMCEIPHWAVVIIHVIISSQPTQSASSCIIFLHGISCLQNARAVSWKGVIHADFISN